MPTYRRVQEIEHEIGADGAFSLAVTSADVRLVAADGSEVRVRATFEMSASSEADADELFGAAQLRTSRDSGSLLVDEPNGRGGFGSALSRLFGGQTVELWGVEVAAPAACRMDVQVVRGDVQAHGFRGSQRYRSVSGDLRLADTGGELDVESVSGDVSLRAVEPVSLKITSVSGDVSAEAPAFRRARASTVSGDVSIDGELGAAAHSVDTVSGDFRLASNTGMTVSVRGMSTDIRSSLPHRVEGNAERRQLIVGDGRAQVAFNSMSGDLAVTRSRRSPAAIPAPAPDAQLDVLGALERGEISVEEAMRRLSSAP
jgi:hypothetical protein